MPNFLCLRTSGGALKLVSFGRTAPPAPQAPADLIAVGQTTSTVSLLWTDVVDATSSIVQRSPDGSTGWTTVATPTVNTHTDSNLTAATPYFYRVASVGVGGTSAFTATANPTTATIAAIGTPSALTATALSPTTVRVTLSGSAGLETVFQRSADGGTTWPFSVHSLALNSFLIDSGLTPGMTYQYRAANTSYGNTSSVDSSPVSVTMPGASLSLTAPTSLVVTNVTSCSAMISWTPEANRAEDGFLIERSADGGSTWRVVAPNLAHGTAYFADLGLEPGGSYQWRVTSYSGRAVTGPVSATFANSATSAPTGATTTPGASGAAPAAPSALTAGAWSDTVISLEWQLNDQAESGTKVEWSTDGGSTWTELFVVGKWTWQCHVIGLSASTSYKFRVRTFNPGGDSAYSSVATASTLAGGATFASALAPPKLFLTPQQLAIYQQMQADYNAAPAAPTTFGGQLFKVIKGYADGEVAYVGGDDSTITYGSQGQWSAILYQITGDATYAASAYAVATAAVTTTQAITGWIGYADISGTLSGTDNGDFLRDAISLQMFVYDWASPGWTDAQRTLFARALHKWVAFWWGWNLASGAGREYGGFIHSNMNVFCNAFWGAALWDAIGAPDDPYAGYWTLQDTGSQDVPVGGLQPSLISQQGTPDYSTLASEVAGAWAQFRLGGVGIESDQYNIDTGRYFAFYSEGIRMARSLVGDNNDYHPLARTTVRQCGIAEAMAFSPDLQQIWQWGDDDNPRQFFNGGHISERTELLGLHAGVCRGNATIAPALHGMIQELWDANGVGQILNATVPHWRQVLLFNPYLTTAPRSSLPASLTAPGAGMTYYHQGYSTNDSFFGALFLPVTFVDHTPNHFGDFQLFRQAEWALTRPLAYGQIVQDGEGANAMLIGGLSSFSNIGGGASSHTSGFRGVVGQQIGSGPIFAYSAGLTWGPQYFSGYEPPPEFCHEWTRSVVYLPSSDKKSDTVVVFDRTLASNPFYLPCLAGGTAVAITAVASGTGGNCRLTTGTDHGMTASAGSYAEISGVVGTTEANGHFLISAVPSSVTFEVPVPFVHAYVSGGEVLWVGTGRYSAGPALGGLSDLDRMNANPTSGTPALKQWILHSPTQPTVTGTKMTWASYGGASDLTWECLLPTSPTIQGYDEETLWSPPACQQDQAVTETASDVPFSPERRWQTRVWPSVAWPSDGDPHWDVFLNVIFATNASGGPTVAATLVQSSGSEAAGALLSRSGLDDALLLFSQVASTWDGTVTAFQRILSTGYTVTWTSAAATTDILLFDLNMARTWTCTLDGGGSQSVSVGAAGTDGGLSFGTGQLTITGTGSHTLVLTGT